MNDAFHQVRDVGEPLAVSHPDSSTPKFANHDEHLAAIAAANNGFGFASADVSDGIRSDPRPPGGLRSLLEAVSRERNIPLHELTSATRAHPVAHARQDFMWRARQVRWPDGRPRYSLPFIARFLGMKDHTSILHGVRAHEGRLSTGQSPNGEIIAA